MNYILRIFYPDYIQDVPVEDGLLIGNGGTVSVQDAVYCFRFVPNISRDLSYSVYDQNNKWQQLYDGDFLYFSQSIMALFFQEESDELLRVNGRFSENILIGRNNSTCDLVLPSRPSVPSDVVLTSGEHVRLKRDMDRWKICLIKEQAKVYLNGKLVKTTSYLKKNDWICLGKYTLEWNGVELIASVKYKNQENFGEKIQPVLPKKMNVQPPVFNRSPHIQTKIDVYTLKAPQMEHVGEKPEMNWLATLLPPIGMMIVMIATCLITKNTGSLAFTFPMYCISMIVSILNYQSQKKKFKKRKEQALLNFQQNCAAEEKQINELKAKQLKILKREYPSLDECMQIVKNRDVRMWRCRPEDDGFMNLRLGSGAIPTNIQIQQGNHFDVGRDFIKNAVVLENAPVSCSLKEYQNVGLIGLRETILTVMKNIVIQTAVNHVYDEVNIVAFFPESEKKEWEWMRWLPHVHDKLRQKRFLACDVRNVISMCRDFEEVLSWRLSEHNKTEEKKVHYLFVIGDFSMVSRQRLADLLSNNDPNLAISTLYLAPNLAHLPSGCQAIIEMKGDGTGIWYPKQDSGQKHVFDYDRWEKEKYDKLARTMAPIRLMEGAGEQQFPSCITFLEGYKVNRVEELPVERYWTNACPEKTMAVPVGVKRNGEIFNFDINSKCHGPHGMVAGQTGSGKSEMVQSWILSMALHFSPQDVSFVIVDYKGDGLLAPFKNLPHLAGTISNLDRNITRNIISLNIELERRMRLFSKFGANNIRDYRKKREGNALGEAMPYLIILLDEFADFKSQHPEFLEIVERIYTMGGSLGVYIVILAQDPASAITPKIEKNSRFRWCMQVATNDASKSMLDTADAYTMKKASGRGFIKVGNFEVYEEIQSFWSGASYLPERDKEAGRVPPIAKVDLDGRKHTFVDWEKSMGIWSPEKEIDEVVEYLKNFAEINHIPKAEQVWCPPIPKKIILDDLLEDAFQGENWTSKQEMEIRMGVVDDPRRQKQYILALRMAECGHIAVLGEPSSGKTTALMTAVISLMKTYSPADVQLYFYDYHKWSMNLFGNFPHTRTVSVGEENDEFVRSIQMLRTELKKRKLCFSKAGIISIESYRALTEKIPYIFVIVDGIMNAWNCSSELQDLLKEIAMTGSAYGIYMIASAPGTSLPYSIESFFKTKISLKQPNPSDYIGIVGKTDGLVPEDKCPGRGLIRLGQVVEFQTAFPMTGQTELEQYTDLRQLAGEMQECWKGQECQQKQQIRKDWKEYVKADSMVIGNDTLTDEPVYISLKDKHCLIVSTLEATSLKKMLQIIMLNQIMKKQNRLDDVDELVVFDNYKQYLLENGKQATKYFSLGDKSGDSYLQQLMPVLEQRQREKEENPNKTFPNITIIIVNFKEFFEEAEDETITYLCDIVNLGCGLNVNLIVADFKDGIVYLGNRGEKLTNLLLKQKHAVLVDGSFSEHEVFQTAMGYSESNQKLESEQGYYLSGMEANKFVIFESID